MVHPRKNLGPKALHVYCDESQTSGVRYTVYGGIVIPAKSVVPFEEAVQEWRRKNHYSHEIKWKKCGAESYYKKHVALVDFVFEHIERSHIDFKAVVFDSKDRQYTGYRLDKEKGFYTLYYHFLRKKFVPYGATDDHALYVYLDRRSTKYKLGTLYNVLNSYVKRDKGLKGNIVKIVHPLDSKKSNLIQLADLLMGAIGFQCNDLDKVPGAAQPKVKLAKYIATKAGVTSLAEQTSPYRSDFNIWRFKYDWAKK
jgi:hypothetical protein